MKLLVGSNNRYEAYTQIGIRRVLCFRCGKRSSKQTWSICADNKRFRSLCFHCDLDLNENVLRFMGFSDIENIMRKYCRDMYSEYGDEFVLEWEEEDEKLPYDFIK